ncbi:hypothetical protein D4Z93_00965 [Clostridium fermenticellae]|uniref:TATA-box binding n=1 Tax=Clostridium fermenticellae TaxID=2068654 RepID=A0A386H0N8_9CLOT|nr:YwmB family TATA-box binding protein [Clostridium fermenticellae]AYD39206.1 hypothetical protein D4Z93_00965 [Clostridium fermenticellae]
MWKKGKSFIIIILSIFLVFLFDGFCSKSKISNSNILFDEILKSTKSTVQECDVTASFETSSNGESMCQTIFKTLSQKKDYSINITQNREMYRIEFNKKNENGYIQSIKYGKYNIITIDIDELVNRNKLDDLKTRIKDSLKDEEESVKYFECIKARLADYETIGKCNSQVLKLLRSYNIYDVDTVDLGNGYTSTAYTGLCNNVTKINNKLIDFNYSVCRYYSGSYMIIATPEIIKTY